MLLVGCFSEIEGGLYLKLAGRLLAMSSYSEPFTFAEATD
jgi:hypothetical protein